jgi:Leucine-rich repeat (LRR) protein
MGNCFTKSRSTPHEGVEGSESVKVERMRSFSKRTDLWERTGVVQFQSSKLNEFPFELKSVPPKKVRILDGSKNRLRKVPSYVGLMIYCNRLGLSHNRIPKLPRAIGRMESLRVLLLDSNRIEDLPEEVFNLYKLERLSLANNRLGKLPRAVGNLKQLKYIDISGNKKIKSITSGIAGCKNLEEIRCSDCSVQKLPADAAKLEHLRLVVAENNSIESIASSIFLYCEGLQTMALHGNPITMAKVESTKGYKEFEERRKQKWPEKSKSAGVLLGKKADEEARGPSVLWSSNSGDTKDQRELKGGKNGTGMGGGPARGSVLSSGATSGATTGTANGAMGTPTSVFTGKNTPNSGKNRTDTSNGRLKSE